MFRQGSRFVLLLLSLLGSASTALAAPTLPLDRFEPATAGDPLLVTPAPVVEGHLAPAAAAYLVYAKAPLRLAGATGEVALVDHQLSLHTLASLSLFHRVALDLDVPAVLAQGGESAGEYPGAAGAALGDLRLGARASLLPWRGAVPGAAVTLAAWLPTGDEQAYAGAASARYSLGVVIGAKPRRWRWGLGLTTRHQTSPAHFAGARDGDLLVTAGAVWTHSWWSVGPEAYGSTVVTSTTGWFHRATTNLEALLVARAHCGALTVTAAAGPGIGVGIGTPHHRLLLGVAYAPVGSGANGNPRAASTPAIAPTKPPAPESIDEESGDPRAATPAARSIAGPGLSPTVTRATSADAATGGKPAPAAPHPDRDGDTATESTADDPSIRIVDSAIVIRERITFETGSDRLTPASLPVLAEVVALLDSQPDIVRVAVDGHTDDIGQDLANLALSRRRALAVVRWLVEHGVDERRLEARGFGARRPLVAASTAAARDQNRRVEFQILGRSPRGAEAWRTGELP